MKRFVLSLVLSSMYLTPIFADDAANKEKQGVPATSAAEKLKANPGDIKALNEFLNENMARIVGLSEQKKHDEADRALAETKSFLESLSTDDAAVKQRLGLAQNSLRPYANFVELGRVSLPDLEKALDANPHDAETLSKYMRKTSLLINQLYRSEPEKAESILTSAQARLEKVRPGVTDEAVKTSIESTLASFPRYQQYISSEKARLALIGTDAAPLAVTAWVNGTSLTEADLKGKVVLLDFWAVWCGPCIATFPHLREWQEKYGDKGLVIIGLTQYFNYAWDEAAGRAKKSVEPVTAEAEQEMLKKFAEHHNLHHRFAIQSLNEKNQGKMSELYGVTGIPQAVIIDQQGKIRMIRVGSGGPNAKDLGEMLEQLLAKAPAAGGQ